MSFSCPELLPSVEEGHKMLLKASETSGPCACADLALFDQVTYLISFDFKIK